MERVLDFLQALAVILAYIMIEQGTWASIGLGLVILGLACIAAIGLEQGRITQVIEGGLYFYMVVALFLWMLTSLSMFMWLYGILGGAIIFINAVTFLRPAIALAEKIKGR